MRAARAILWTFAVPAWAWALEALLLFPGWSAAGHWISTTLLVGATALLLWKTPARFRVAIVAGAAAAVAALWMTVTPTTDRAWSVGQERAPRVTFEGDLATIDNVRNATWHSATDVDMRWETRRYDLRGIRTVDLVIEPFDDWRGLAHIFVTFGFADGEHVAISIESRREAGERYSPLRGAFRHYELLYVIGDERDLIGLRANIRRDPVYLFPSRATPDEARALFVSMLKRASQLAVHSEFYNSATSTCATNLIRHVNDVRTHDITIMDWRILFPGYADELAWDLGLIDFAGTLDEARTRFLVNDRSAFDPALDGPGWSRKIRVAP